MDYAAHMVGRGMRLLDGVLGPAWVHKIDLDTLSLSCPCLCVLGQLFGTYIDGLDNLELHGQCDLGFVQRPGVDYPALEDEWRRRIQLAQQENPLPCTPRS